MQRSLVKEHSKNADFFAIFPENFFDNFKNDKNLTSSIELLYDPSLNTAVIMLLESVLKEKVVMLYGLNDNPKFTPIFLSNMQKEFIKKLPFGKNIPNSVEQSVPSWLVFAMFFVLIPLSTVLMVEKDQGTFKRLQSLKISPLLFFGAKTLTYNIINILQGILMILVGVYLTPLFGLDTLRISSPFAVFVLIYSLSLAAIGFALLIATISKTSGQAIIVGGLSNVLLGSIGGIMIPKYVMPEGAQMLSNISPMSWGLDGFLELFLNQGTIADIWQYVGVLSLFGFVLFCVSLFIFNRQKGD